MLLPAAFDNDTWSKAFANQFGHLPSTENHSFSSEGCSKSACPVTPHAHVFFTLSINFSSLGLDFGAHFGVQKAAQDSSDASKSPQRAPKIDFGGPRSRPRAAKSVQDAPERVFVGSKMAPMPTSESPEVAKDALSTSKHHLIVFGLNGKGFCAC